MYIKRDCSENKAEQPQFLYYKREKINRYANRKSDDRRNQKRKSRVFQASGFFFDCHKRRWAGEMHKRKDNETNPGYRCPAIGG